MKKCSKCKVTKQVVEFNKHSRTKDGYYSQCRLCASQSKIQHRLDNRERMQIKDRAYYRQAIKRKMLAGAKKRSGRKNWLFDLMVEDIIIPEVCPVLGIPLFVGDDTCSDNSPTLDRIDPNGFYTKDNVQVISLRANRIKNDATLEELEALVMYMRRMVPA